MHQCIFQSLLAFIIPKTEYVATYYMSFLQRLNKGLVEVDIWWIFFVVVVTRLLHIGSHIYMTKSY